MAKEYAKEFYRSNAWRKCRAAYIASRKAVDGGMCERCGSNLGFIVHHKTYLTPYNITNPAVALSHENLQLVCKCCHDDEHFTPQEKDLKCLFDEKGRPIGIT